MPAYSCRARHRPHHSFPLTPRAVSFSVWLSDGDDEMAKAVQVFTGNDSYGRYSEYAQREDGKWFCRDYAYNGYGNGMTKWIARREIQDLDRLVKGDILDYGFKPLHRGNPQGLRLPNPVPAFT